jgi:hypothetical protein
VAKTAAVIQQRKHIVVFLGPIRSHSHPLTIKPNN